MCEENKKKKLFWGLLLIAVGSLLLARNLDLLPFAIPPYVFTWKMLLLVIGISFLVSGNKIGGGITLIAISLFFLLPEILGVPHLDFHKLWPIFLILIGFGAIFRRKRNGFKHKKKEWSGSPQIDKDKDKMEAAAIFGGENKKISSYNYKGGKVTAIFGGMELDLTNCYMASEKAEIDVMLVCGGVTLKVPKDWNVRSEIVPVMGGVEDHIVSMPGTYTDPAAELTLKGTVVMGGIEIYRV